MTNQQRDCNLWIPDTTEGTGPDGKRRLLFYGSVFSNFYPSPFLLDGQAFVNAEQYFHWRKAKLFKDEDRMAAILASPFPMQQKMLGRQVIGYSDAVWATDDQAAMEDALMAKFGQNAGLRAELMKTEGYELVEASPTDRKWGVGLDQSDPEALDPKAWLGDNRLGKALDLVRSRLAEERCNK